MDLVKVFQDFGLEGGFAVGAFMFMATISFFLIKWALRQQDKILDMADKNTERWQKALDDHTSQAKDFHKEVKDAHMYQRQEHEKITSCLTQVEKVLGRMNGYK